MAIATQLKQMITSGIRARIVISKSHFIPYLRCRQTKNLYYLTKNSEPVIVLNVPKNVPFTCFRELFFAFSFNINNIKTGKNEKF